MGSHTENNCVRLHIACIPQIELEKATLQSENSLYYIQKEMFLKESITAFELFTFIDSESVRLVTNVLQTLY